MKEKIKIPFSPLKPMHDELKQKLEAAYHSVMEKGHFIQGDECGLFEKKFAQYCEADYCIGVGNGLDALILILKAYDISRGDEVIIPSNTYIATALAVSSVGATPVLVEPEIDTYNIDASKIESAVTKRTRAVIAVHLQGRSADMDAIRVVTDKYHLHLFEDAAQAHGARYKGKKVGALSDAAGFSFYPGKNLGAMGDGGCVVTNHREVADKIRILSNYGSDYKYHNIYQGVNSRLDELQSALLLVKLEHLDKWNLKRQGIAKSYLENIQNSKIILPLPSTDDHTHIYHVFAIRCDKRDELEKYLNEHGIETLKHYPIPIHRQQAYQSLKIPEGVLPIAEEISRTILSIPMYYGITDEEVNFVVKKLNLWKGN